jgi:hypothetical protein
MAGQIGGFEHTNMGRVSQLRIKAGHLISSLLTRGFSRGLLAYYTSAY